MSRRTSQSSAKCCNSTDYSRFLDCPAHYSWQRNVDIPQPLSICQTAFPNHVCLSWTYLTELVQPDEIATNCFQSLTLLDTLAIPSLPIYLARRSPIQKYPRSCSVPSLPSNFAFVGFEVETVQGSHHATG